MTIQHAQVHFSPQGTPIANAFDDPYFSKDQGLAESQYVFMQQNQLPERWLNHPHNEFVIAESGFGTGLNCLLAWHCFAEFKHEHPNSQVKRLRFISVEKFPLSPADLTTALAAWPELAKYAHALLDSYPSAVPGCHRLQLDNMLCLDLWFGDINEVLPGIQTPPQGLVDAWFLDGFAPSKNPQMWQDSLFTQCARLAKASATFATFTAAGIVKRGLQQVGFQVEKRPGFGRKRDMLAGYLPQKTPVADYAWYARHAATTGHKQTVSIVGAGLAGAHCALAMAKRGYQVTLYARGEQAADGASGNPLGGFYPQLTVQPSVSALFYAQAFLYAHKHYQALSKQGFAFAHDFCGVLQLGFNPKQQARCEAMIENGHWPSDLVHGVNAGQASKLAQLPLSCPALHIPFGGWISPPQLINALLTAAAEQGRLQVNYQHHLSSLERHEQGWQLHWQSQQATQADLVIIACGHSSASISQLTELPLQAVRGQVERVHSKGKISNLQKVLCHKGYFTPQWQGEHALGSTYVKNTDNTQYRTEEATQNLNMQQQALATCAWPAQLILAGTGRAAIRCATPDRLPLVGAVPDFAAQQQSYQHLYKALPREHYASAADHANLYCLTGLGSRGLVSAPLLAELLASQIHGEALPLSEQHLAALSPNRFLVRDLIRRQGLLHY